MAQAEMVVRTILRNVLDICEAKNVSIVQSLERSTAQALIGNLIKAVILDPNSGFSPDQTLAPQHITALTEQVADMLLTNNVGVQAVVLQVIFGANFKTIEQVSRAVAQEANELVADIERDVLNARIGTRDDLEALYRNIVSYVLLRSQLGSPTDLTVVKETTAALESVLPPEDLGTFVKMTRTDKKTQLLDLTIICMGIRLFSRYLNKGGRNIPDVPAELQRQFGKFATEARAIYQQCGNLATRMADYLHNKAAADNEGTAESAKMYTILARQVMGHLEACSGVVAESAQRTERLLKTYEETQQQVKTAVEARDAVPTDHIFPLFARLGEIWRQFSEEAELLSSILHLLEDIQSLCQIMDELPAALQETFEDVPFVHEIDARLQWTFNRAIVTALSHAGLPAPDDIKAAAPERQQEHVRLSELRQAKDHVELLMESSTHDFDHLPLQLAGYCPVTLVEKGALIPGQRYLGLIRRGNLLYNFASREALIAFVRDPEAVLTGVMNAARTTLALLEVLRLHHRLTSMTSVQQAQAGMQASLAVKKDSSCQTELHPIESHIDKNYEWNEWELRRKALKLADLRRKQTHSTQTHLSHFRRENSTQVYLPKTKSIQTRKDGYTNTSKPVTYVRGLRGPRGPRAEPPEVVDLTLRVGGFAMEPISK